MNIENHDDHIRVSQDEFVRNFESIPISPSRLSQKNAKLTSEELALLRSLVGQANWIASQTRPDISYDVLELSMCLSRQPEVRHLIQANKLVRKIKANDFALKFSKIDSDEELKLVVYADASHANLPDGASSTAGHLVFIAGGDKASVLSWRSSKIKRVVRSSTAAESLALSDALDDALFLREMIGELIGKKLQIHANIDNNNLHTLIHSTTSITEKRLRIEIAAVKEMIEKQEVASVNWVKSDDQLANCLTKRGASSQKLIHVLTSGSF